MHPARAANANATTGQRPAARLRRVGAWLLVVALLFGQGLGLVHAITHCAPGWHSHAHSNAHGHEHGHEHRQAQDHGLAGTPHVHGPACQDAQAPGLQALFDHDPDEPACRLYDQLLLAGLWLPAPPVLAAPVDSQRAVPATAAVRVAARAAAYLARGPPQA